MIAVELPVIVGHAGHWLASFIYLVPVLLVLAALAVQTIRERRRDGRDERPRPGVGD